MNDMKHMLSLMRRAIDDYRMIEPGDRIAVGISGGKDSLTLLAVLAALQKFYPIPFSLVAITVDIGLPDMDFSPVEAFCRELGVPYVVAKTEIASIIFDVRRESNPCSLCAKMRRGSLHSTALAEGCNKVALGHHKDDAVETFMMNLFCGGNIGCFRPVTYLSNKDLWLIRPMILAEESKINALVKNKNLPIVKSTCPMDKNTERQHSKELIRSLEKDYPDLKTKILGAMERADISGW